jgi:hypothetical protein
MAMAESAINNRANSLTPSARCSCV